MAEASALDLDLFLSLPRVVGVAVSPDGARLVVDVHEAAPDGSRYVGALWEVDPEGERDPRRLTWSEGGESFGAFLRDGSVLFTAARGEEEDRASLWLLPAGGGAAREVAGPPGGVWRVRTARDADAVAFLSERWPGVDARTEAELIRSRQEKGVDARLFDRYPISFLDHFLGPTHPRLFVARAPRGPEGGLTEMRDLTPDAVAALEARDETDFDVAANGSFVVSTWLRYPGKGKVTSDIVSIDARSGDRRVIATGERHSFISPRISPDGATVVAVRVAEGIPGRSPQEVTLWLIDVATGHGQPLAADLDRWPSGPVWTADGAGIVFTADDGGSTPIFRVETGPDRRGETTRLTAEGCYSNLCVAPDGSAIYALASSMTSPPTIVRLDPATPDQMPQALASPGTPVPFTPPACVESITTAASDGASVQAWLVTPRSASPESPAPLVVLVHGGPFAAWGAWHWRQNPLLFAERGHAVVLPNPALSTGFGQDFIRRGSGRWGLTPYTDVMATVDAACSRPDIDGSRVAAIGGSFGGYITNWMAGHTDRFRCLVTHAGLWSLRQYHGTSDEGLLMEEELGDPYQDPVRYLDNSPHRSVADIRTPLLIIHGARDHRAPLSEAISLWTDLMRHDANARFLYFPDEHHWILKPNNIRVWYEVVFAFLAEHLLEDPTAWESPFLQSLGLVPTPARAGSPPGS